MSQEDIRRELRAKRRTLEPAELTRAGEQLAEQVMKLPALNGARHVAGYLAIRGEIPLDQCFEQLRQREIKLYLPVLCGIRMRFAPWTEETPLVEKSLGILEPDCPPELHVSGMSLDAVLVPLVAFDRHGHRIGQGGGYYDRAFEKRGKNSTLTHPTLIGVAHALQEVAEIPTNLWDVSMDYICTDKKTLQVQP